MSLPPVNASCFCGVTDYDVTPAAAACRRCGRIWKRITGAWFMDDLTPAQLEQAIAEGRSLEVERLVLTDAVAPFIEFDFEIPKNRDVSPEVLDRTYEELKKLSREYKLTTVVRKKP